MVNSLPMPTMLLYADAAAHQLHQIFRNGQAQAGAAENRWWSKWNPPAQRAIEDSAPDGLPPGCRMPVSLTT
jgi:hypothetical protein